MKGLESKTLGKSGIEVTRVGLGCASLGGMYGDIPEEQAHDVVRRALSSGAHGSRARRRVSPREDPQLCPPRIQQRAFCGRRKSRWRRSSVRLGL